MISPSLPPFGFTNQGLVGVSSPSDTMRIQAGGANATMAPQSSNGAMMVVGIHDYYNTYGENGAHQPSNLNSLGFVGWHASHLP